MRRDSLDSLLATKRIPFGLIGYKVNCFTATSVQKVSKIVPMRIALLLINLFPGKCPKDYRSWLQTMYNFLVRSGQRFFVDQCGATIQLCNPVMVP